MPLIWFSICCSCAHSQSSSLDELCFDNWLSLSVCPLAHLTNGCRCVTLCSKHASHTSHAWDETTLDWVWGKALRQFCLWACPVGEIACQSIQMLQDEIMSPGTAVRRCVVCGCFVVTSNMLLFTTNVRARCPFCFIIVSYYCFPFHLGDLNTVGCLFFFQRRMHEEIPMINPDNLLLFEELRADPDRLRRLELWGQVKRVKRVKSCRIAALLVCRLAPL